MEDNITTIEELNATIAALKEQNQALSAENESLKAELGQKQDAAEAAKKDFERMRDWWGEEKAQHDRIKGVMKAIGTLLDAIQ